MGKKKRYYWLDLDAEKFDKEIDEMSEQQGKDIATFVFYLLADARDCIVAAFVYSLLISIINFVVVVVFILIYLLS